MSTRERGILRAVLLVSAIALWFLIGPGVPQPACGVEGTGHVGNVPESAAAHLPVLRAAPESLVWGLSRFAWNACAEARGSKTRAGNPDMALLRAAGQGNAQEVERLLEQGADVNARAKKGDFTPLIWAASRGHAETVKVLLERGADVHAAASEGGRTALGWATNQGYGNVAKLLLRKGADPNVAETIIHLTPLRDAAEKGRTQIVALLLESNADINAADPSGNTALMLAAKKGRTDTVALLLAKGADVNARDKRGQTAFDIATRSGHKKIAALFGQQGPVPAEVTRRPDGEKKQVPAAKQQAPRLAEPSKVGLAEPRPGTGNESLLAAAAKGDARAVKKLLEEGSDINCRDPLGNTPLILAAANGHLEVTRILVDSGADVKAVQLSGLNALHWAAQNGHKALEELLLGHGAMYPEMTQQERPGQQSKPAATEPPAEDAKPKPPKAPEPAAKPEDTIRSLIQAAKQGDEKELTRLIDQGADLNARGADGSTALMWSCVSPNCLRVARLLVDKGADVNAKDNSGKTALSRADEQSVFTAEDQLLLQDFKELLLKHGAVDEQLASVKDKNQGLLVAAGKGYVSVVKRLVADGGDVNYRGSLGQTALIEASGNGYVEIVRFLLDEGADPRVRDHAGNTALTYATETKRKEVQSLLQKALASVSAAPTGRPEEPSSPSAGKRRLGARVPGSP